MKNLLDSSPRCWRSWRCKAARLAELEEENRRLRSGKGGGTPLAVKPSRPPKEAPKERKRRDRGYARPREEQVDERLEHAVEQCPECGRKLEGGWEHASRQVIEVVVQKRVVEHVFMARRCGVCQQRWIPSAAELGWGCRGSGGSERACRRWWPGCIAKAGRRADHPQIPPGSLRPAREHGGSAEPAGGGDAGGRWSWRGCDSSFGRLRRCVRMRRGGGKTSKRVSVGLLHPGVALL